jgi:hypothetical protein
MSELLKIIRIRRENFLCDIRRLLECLSNSLKYKQSLFSEIISITLKNSQIRLTQKEQSPRKLLIERLSRNMDSVLKKNSRN